MRLLLIGMNHRTAPIQLREQMNFSVEGTATALLLLHNRWPDSEAVILSTCNRLELLIASEDGHPDEDEVISFLAQARDLPADAFRRYLYVHRDMHAVRHVFRVAGGLDSLVIGEYQIVSQLKQAYTAASEQGTTGRTLNRLMHHAFKASGRIRTETDIGRRTISVPSVAVDFARGIFSDFSQKKTLVIGAGEMAQLVCKHLQDLDVSHFTVTSRTLNNARALAEACAGRAVPYADLDDAMAEADIIIAATRCPRPIITAERWRQVARRRGGRPVYIIDLAVPRNVDAEVGRFSQVFLQDIDQLGAVVAENEQARAEQVGLCERILDAETESFEQWLLTSRTGPLIAQMYQDARTLRDLELERLERQCPGLSADQHAAVSQLAERLINKFMHPCVQTLKQHAVCEPTATLAAGFHDVTVKQARQGGASGWPAGRRRLKAAADN